MGDGGGGRGSGERGRAQCPKWCWNPGTSMRGFMQRATAATGHPRPSVWSANFESQAAIAGSVPCAVETTVPVHHPQHLASSCYDPPAASATCY